MGEPSGLLDEHVDGLGAAVAQPVGVEVRQHLRPPGTKRPSQSRDLGDRAKQADQMRQDAETGTQRLEVQLRLRLTAIEAARAKLLADHMEELETEALGALVAELDLEEEQIRVALGER